MKIMIRKSAALFILLVFIIMAAQIDGADVLALETSEGISSQDLETDSEACNIEFDVFAPKEIYENREKVEIKFMISPKQTGFKIEYWVEDLFGKIYKAKYNTTNNTNTKTWTPNIEDQEKTFLIKADLHTACSNEPVTISSQYAITVMGEQDTGNEPGEIEEWGGDEEGEEGDEECRIEFEAFTDKEIYLNKEKVEIKFMISPKQTGFIIEYWVEDLFGKIYKAKYNTTNTNTKTWTPNIEDQEKTFLIKADLHTACSNETATISSNDMITVMGTPKPSDSSINIKEVYTSKEGTIEFGKALRVMLEIYKGDESTSTVQAWIEDLNSNEKISEVSRILVYDRFREYKITVPLQIKSNCDRKYHDGAYTLVAEGFGIRETQRVRVEGIASSLCPAGAADSNNIVQDNNKITYEIIGFDEEITIREESMAVVRISNDKDSHEFTLWSYIYRGSKSYSGEREQNAVSVSMGPGEIRTIELFNVVEEAEPGEYKLKIKIQKDALKTTTDFTKDVILEKAEEIHEDTETISREIAMILNPIDALQENQSGSNNSEGIEKLTGMTIYRSKSKRAEGLAPYLIIAALAALIMIVSVGLLKKRKKTNPKALKTDI